MVYMKFLKLISKFDINRHCIVLSRKLYNFQYSGEYEAKNYSIRIMGDVEQDYFFWCEIINRGYSEGCYNVDKAKKLLNNHPLFNNLETYFLYRGENIQLELFLLVNTKKILL